MMAATGSLLAAVVGNVLLPFFSASPTPSDTDTDQKRVLAAPFLLFAKPAVTCAIASPLGYMALKYIPFPLGEHSISMRCCAVFNVSLQTSDT